MNRPMFNPAAVNTAPLTPAPKIPDTFDPQAERERLKRIYEDEQSLWTRPLGPLKNWSFSGLMTYEGCAYRRYLNQVAGAREPSGPAAERGSRLHTYIEDFIQHKTDTLHKDVLKWRGLIGELRDEYDRERVSVEGEWGFTRTWETTGWKDDNVWARVKLDAIHFDSNTSACVEDWKSGKKFGNEVKHATQLTVYSIATFMRYPNIEYVHSAMRYIDKGEELVAKFTREEAMMFKPSIEKRALIMTTATDFPPSPSKHNCKWCRLKEPLEGESTPRCLWGVVD